MQCLEVKVKIGGLEATGNKVKSFTITRQRGTLWASASATIEANVEDSQQYLDDMLVIEAGDLRFEGRIVGINSAPRNPECGGVYIISASAYDKLYDLRNVKITRKAKVDPGKTWCVITGIQSSGRMGQSIEIPEHRTSIAVVNASQPLDTSILDDVGEITKTQPLPIGAAGVAGGAGGITPHKHTSFDEGGPAVGVFGDYKLYIDE